MSLETDPRQDRVVVTRDTAEIGMALATFAFGAIVLSGSLEFGVGWSSAGPGPGSFPGLVGLAIMAASGVTFVQGVRARWRRTPGVQAPALLTSVQAKRVLAFTGPMLAFTAAAFVLGLYVAATVYLASVMILQGRYRVWQGLAVGVGASLAFYVVLERWFQVPLLKGPLEALLGIN
jgi:hypothetical protein